MKLIKTYIIVFCGLLLLGANSSTREQETMDLSWGDLVPKDYVFENPLAKLSDEEFFAIMNDAEKSVEWETKIKKMNDFAPVVEVLNGKNVRISGYALPLDFQAQDVRELLLVPYVGACIHVPPPPGNQTIYVTTEKGFKVESLWTPISVVGKMETVHISNDLAEAGYKIIASTIEPYKQPAENLYKPDKRSEENL